MIYILLLENNNYYVGKTNREGDERILEHFAGNGSKFTQKYKPLKVLHKINDNSKYAELNHTLDTMEKYGIDNVRGNTFTNIELSYFEKKFIIDLINSKKNACYNCGQKGHFRNKCPKKTVKVEEKDNIPEERLSGKKRPRDEESEVLCEPNEKRFKSE